MLVVRPLPLLIRPLVIIILFRVKQKICLAVRVLAQLNSQMQFRVQHTKFIKYCT